MMTLPTLMAVLAQVGRGRIEGGWGYVWACYAVTIATLILYALSLWVRRTRASPDAKE